MWDELEKLLAEASKHSTDIMAMFDAEDALAAFLADNAPAMLAENKRLRAWQEAAFEAHPNIDLDIAALNEGKQP